MPRLNVTTFLGIGGVVETVSTSTDLKPSGEIVCCCMFGDRKKIREAFAVIVAGGAVGTFFLFVLASVMVESIAIFCSIGAGLTCVALLYAVWYYRAGKQTVISGASV